MGYDHEAVGVLRLGFSLWRLSFGDPGSQYDHWRDLDITVFLVNVSIIVMMLRGLYLLDGLAFSAPVYTPQHS